MDHYIDFDILYVIYELDKKYNGLLENEIQVLLYLSSLLALYDSNPLAEWGYNFIGVDNQPYSSDIPKRINTLLKSNYIQSTQSDGRYSITKKGESLYKLIRSLSYAKTRVKYLSAAIDSFALSSLPLLVNVINNESMLKFVSSSNLSSRQILGEGLLKEISYKDITTLKKVTNETKDLWIVSSLWIKYLTTINQ